MPRKNEQLTRHNILLRPGDLEWLQSTYGIGAAAIIRTLIDRHRREIEKKVNENVPIDALDMRLKT